MKSQTNQNFEWWVYFDSTTKEEFRQLNSSLNISYPNFKPKYETSYDDFEKHMPREIDDHLNDQNIAWLITTRLDNDDVFAVDTIDLIQNAFSKDDMVLLEIPTGLTLDVRKRVRLRKVSRLGNPFISLVENSLPSKMVKGVYHKQHNQWKNVKIKVVSDQTQWIQIIHENNVLNRAIGEEVFHSVITKRFKFNMDNIAFENILLFSGRKISSYSNKFYFKVKRKLKSLFLNDAKCQTAIKQNKEN